MRDLDPLLGALGATVRERRKARGWTRRDLAEHTGISERFLADVETGRANPSIVKLHAIATALDDTPSVLLARAEAATPSGHPRRMLALLGMRGAGKTSVGMAVAARLGLTFVELDREIERSTGLSVGQLFELNDERSYRSIEREVLRELLESNEGPQVIATGGGLVTEPETFGLLRAHAHTVWLRAQPAEHWERVIKQGDTRPMAGAGHDHAFRAMCQILQEREPFYAQADFTLETTDRDIEEVAEEIARRTGSSLAV